MDNFCGQEGTVALVTGAASGIGKACAQQLAALGAAVMLTDIDTSVCEETAAQLSEKGHRVECLKLDVTDEDDWQRVIAQTVERLGGLDTLVNNAGVYVGKTLISNSLEDLRKVNHVNIESVFLGMKYAAIAMQPGGAVGKGGSIVNLSSVAGLVGIPGHSAYGASKGAVRLYTKHAAVEFARLGYGIRVNSVHPGLIATAMGDLAFADFVEIGMAKNVEEAREIVTQMTPLARIGTVEDVANMVAFLASDASSYCTGGEYAVDGGMSSG